MIEIKEDINCYAGQSQRNLMIELAENKSIRDNFFLTGGTALSVFYLHHRISDDIDLFTTGSIDLSELDFWVLRHWKDVRKINQTDSFCSYLINNTKIDLVIDRLSINTLRFKWKFNNDSWIEIDSLDNIISNKLCTLVSRMEIKDFIDFYILGKNLTKDEFERIYMMAIRKDAIFEDPPSVAYHIEETFKMLNGKNLPLPNMLVNIDWDHYKVFYDELAIRIYTRIS